VLNSQLDPRSILHHHASGTIFTINQQFVAGAFSLIYLAEARPSAGTSDTPPKQVVVMAYKPHISYETYDRMTKTLDLLNKEACKHVIRMICYFIDASTGLRLLVVEKWGETLNQYLCGHSHPSLRTITLWAYQIARGLKTIHQCGIVHGGLCTTNLLVGEPKANGDIPLCISGFGTSIIRHGDQMSEQSLSVTYSWYTVSPEIRELIDYIHVRVY